MADFWPLAEAVIRRWSWLVLGGGVSGCLAVLCGLLVWQSSYTAPAQLIRYESPSATEVFGYRSSAPQTFASLFRSPDLLKTVADKAGPPVSPAWLAENLRVMPERNSDIMVVAISDRSPLSTLNLVNLYAREAVRYTQELQAKSAAEISRFVTQQLAQVEIEISALNRRPQHATPATLRAMTAARPSILLEKLQTAREELIDLLGRYTEANPLVKAQRAKVAALEAQFGEKSATNSSSPASGSEAFSGSDDPEVLRSKLQSLENARLTLIGRHRAAQSLEADPPGYYQLLAPATAKDLVKHGRKAKVLMFGIFMALVGLTGAAATAVIIEVMDDRLKTTADVARVTRLPVLATAGDFAGMTQAEQEHWAFRAWTNLQGRLGSSSNRGLVCGVSSAGRSEGRSTWVDLLARAASQRGFRVLTIATKPSPRNGKHHDPPAMAFQTDKPDDLIPAENDAAVMPVDVLATPADVAERLVGPDPQPRVHIPLPGWVWDLERRKQWQAALHHWSQIDNIVILVELPPASEPESVLLAENLPNLIWLTDSARATATETREQLETLRHARCRLAGAVLNHAPRSILDRRFQRWLNLGILLGLLHVCAARAAENNPVNTETNLSLSFIAPSRRAPWQERLTLGPGDSLNFSLYGQPELARLEVPVGPDGRVNFLEAQDVTAAGLTIDELRSRIDTELAKYRRAPRTIVTPAAFRSKKYIMLGGVAQKGVFTLDRPVTVIEAVARARGLATGISDQTTVELADLSHSFLARGGQRVPVDFAKLFQAGDLSQNIPIEPDDYLYFPAGDQREVYVLGEVGSPGSVSFNPGLSTLGALSVRGGFSERAWKRKVLVVRGSLSQPKTFIVDAADVLTGRGPDFKLEPGDIIYVGHRPWIKAEELLDAAASAFIQAVVITWAGDRVGPLIK